MTGTGKRIVVWSGLVILALAILLISMSESVIGQSAATNQVNQEQTGQTASAASVSTKDITLDPDSIHQQTATPQPSPTNNGGSATWSVKSNMFTSKYPKGFTFSLTATSSTGKISHATVIWSHAPGYLKRANGTISPDGTISAEWITASSDSTPAWVSVEYWWELQDEAGNTYQTPHSIAEYEDKTHQWHHAESEDVTVYWQDGVPNEIGSTVIKAMKEQRLFYYRNWGNLLNYKPRAVIFLDTASFAEWNRDLTTVTNDVQIGGLTQPSWGASAQVYFSARGPEFTAYTIVLHEFGHLYQAATGVNLSNPDWFIEGDATYFELHENPSCVDKSKQLALDETLPSLQGDGPGVRGGDVTGYYVGCAFFNWLAETYGPDAHLKLWALIGKGTLRQDALQAVTGLSLPDMDTAFRKWLGMINPVAPTPVELPPLDFPPTAAPKP